jgi:HSP20 family protein
MGLTGVVIMTENLTKLPIGKDQQTAKPVERPRMPLDMLRQEVDRLFEDFHPFSWRLPFGLPARAELGAGTDWMPAPAVDMTEKNDCYEITAELAGLDDKNIEVKLANGVLSIRGEKSEEKQEEKKDYHLSERRYGSFQRSFRVPEGVDVDKIEATISKGLLTISLPKSAEAVQNEKKIDIRAA